MFITLQWMSETIFTLYWYFISIAFENINNEFSENGTLIELRSFYTFQVFSADNFRNNQKYRKIHVSSFKTDKLTSIHYRCQHNLVLLLDFFFCDLTNQIFLPKVNKNLRMLLKIRPESNLFGRPEMLIQYIVFS